MIHVEKKKNLLTYIDKKWTYSLWVWSNYKILYVIIWLRLPSWWCEGKQTFMLPFERTIWLCSVEPSTTSFCASPIKKKASSWLWQNWFNCICCLEPKSEDLRMPWLRVSRCFDTHLAFSHTGGASFLHTNVCILQSWLWCWADPGVGWKSLGAPGRVRPQ